ncbi:MAG: glycosyltransferase family 39 protein [Silvanigrellales bacterium]|nr:glycosyltransferase family 39 protein [Silvanigrellales bacterium]
MRLCIRWSVLAAVIAGFAIRTIAFQNYLPGLNQDEASSGYEAWSLWHTGFDRWGEVRWPVYFTAWGSGQNVLLSYLIAPIVGTFGMSSLSVRALPFLLALVTLPLVYFLMRRVTNTRIAFISLCFLALSPWHIMMSAWALESNLLPFFLVLTLYFLESWRAKPGCLSWLALAGAGVAACLYAYGTAVLVVPLIVSLYMASDLQKAGRAGVSRFKSLSFALAPAIVLSTPFLLFTFKNYVIRANLGFERWLPFGLQLLPVTRLSELGEETQGGTLYHNVSFILSAFDDKLLWNTMPGHKPFLWGVLALALFQGVRSLAAIRRRDCGSLWPLLWTASSLPLFLLVPLNVNRANALWIPLLCLAAQGMDSLLAFFSEKSASLRTTVGATLILFLLADFGWFFRDYKKKFPHLTQDYLRFHMPAALVEVRRMQDFTGFRSVYVSPKAFWGYLYIAFHGQMDPREFRAIRETRGYPYHADKLGDFFFDEQMLRRYGPEHYVYLYYRNERAPCSDPKAVTFVEIWQIGLCQRQSSS